MWGESVPTDHRARHDLFEPQSFASSLEKPMLLAALLYRIAVEFLFYHELHHVLLGHVGLMRRVRRGARMVESRMLNDITAEHQRSMEYAADLFASKTLHDSIGRRRFSLLTPQSLVGFSDDHLMYAGMLAILTLFYTFQLNDRSEHSGYPPLSVRTLTFVDHWTRESHGGESMEREVWDHTASTALRAVRTAFSELYDDVPLLSFGEEEDAIDRAFEMQSHLVIAANKHLPSWQPFAIRAGRVTAVSFENDGSPPS